MLLPLKTNTVKKVQELNIEGRYFANLIILF